MGATRPLDVFTARHLLLAGALSLVSLLAVGDGPLERAAEPCALGEPQETDADEVRA